MIYNPWFESRGIDAVVMPLGVRAGHQAQVLAALRLLTNFHGALVTMPHKVSTVALLDAVTTRVRVAGSCNAVLRRPDGSLLGDLFDGEGFVRGVLRKGVVLAGARTLVVGCGGVGSAIAASLAGAGAACIALHDLDASRVEALAGRLRDHHPGVQVLTAGNDPAGFDLVINATPLGMRDDDPLPVDALRLGASTFVGEVVMKSEMTPFLRAARQRGCRVQVGTDMLFEQIPAYLEFFGFGQATAEELRAVSRIRYTA